MSTNFINKELTLKCPLYNKSLDGCPSSEPRSFVLSSENERNLLKFCTSPKYKKCSIFTHFSEKAA